MVSVDVVVASYNHRKFIQRMIDSILANAETVPLHLWILDDGSKDGSREFLETINDDRITVGFNPVNMGACSAINKGIAMGHAPFVALCNSDDTWEPNKLKIQLEVLESNQDAVSFTLANFIDEQDEVLPNGLGPYNAKTFQVPEGWSRYDWIRLLSRGGNKLVAPSFMCRRAHLDRVGAFDNRYRQIHDMDMWIRIFQFTDPIIVPQKLVNFRLLENDGNTSSASRSNTARLKLEYMLHARKFFKTVPDGIFRKTYAPWIERNDLTLFDTKVLAMMATNIQRLQMLAMEFLAENLETSVEKSDLTFLDLHELSGRFRY